MATKRLRVAWFADLFSSQNEEQSYSSYCTQLLLPLLSKDYDIELFGDRSGVFMGYKVQHFLTAKQYHGQHSFDLFFYQLEDRKSSQWLRILACLYPGIIYFHDFLFTSFGPEPILNSPWQKMIAGFNGADLAWPELLDEQEQLGPQAYREAAFAAVRIFSQPTALRESNKEIKLHIQGAKAVPCYYLPFPVAQGHFNKPVVFKRKLFMCAPPWMQHRSQLVLEAVANFDANLPITWLTTKSELPIISELVSRYNLKKVELICGRTPNKWAELVSEGGLAVHTLFSVYGQTGPYLPISMAYGAPTILTHFSDSEYIPSNLAFKVQAGATEVTEYIKVFDLVFNQQIYPEPNLIKQFAREVFLDLQLAGDLAHIFDTEHEQIRNVAGEWELFMEKARARLVQQAKHLLPDNTDDLRLNQCVNQVYQEFQW